MPPIKYNPSDVKTAVDEHELATKDLRDRMDEDYDKRWSLAKYEGITDEEGVNALAGFRKYTGNDSRAYAKKDISLLSSATVIWKIESDDSFEEQRNIDNDKERFAHGVIRENDERLERQMKHPLLDEMSWYGCCRGWIATRSLIVKTTEKRQGLLAQFLPDETTGRAEIEPLDPRNVFWAMGKDGPEWVVYKSSKTTSQIEAEFGVKVESDDPHEHHDVFDLYDATNNYVCTEDRMLKKATPHGDTSVPVNIVPVGPAPHITNSDDGMSQFGESIFDTSREQWDELNFTMSVMSTMTERSLRQGLKVKSPDGDMTLQNDPYLTGAQVPLAEGEDVEPLGLLEMAPELAPYQALVSGQGQRGALPYTAFGEVGIALSGFAITQLASQQGDAIKFVARAIETSYKLAMNTLARQYGSGNFPTLTLSGTQDDAFFKKEIPIEVVKQGGPYTVKLRPNLPKDDLTRYQVANAARDPSSGMALMSTRRVLEDIIEVDDADLYQNEVLKEMGTRGTPMAQAFILMQAAEERGEREIAAIYFAELQEQMARKQFERQILALQAQGILPPGGGGGAPSANGTGGGSTNGAGPSQPPPEVQPPQARGINAAPTQQSGPLVPPGTPRPGAQGPPSELQRLAQINLVPPR